MWRKVCRFFDLVEAVLNYYRMLLANCLVLLALGVTGFWDALVLIYPCRPKTREESLLCIQDLMRKLGWELEIRKDDHELEANQNKK